MKERSKVGLVGLVGLAWFIGLGALGVVASALAVRSTGAADPLFFVA